LLAGAVAALVAELATTDLVADPLEATESAGTVAARATSAQRVLRG